MRRSFLQNNIRKSKVTWRHLSVTARTVAALTALFFVSACSKEPEFVSLDPERQAIALVEVEQKQSQGLRVWCVPYARDLSGINIRGNAKDWWGKARDIYARGPEPVVGSVMSFRPTRSMSLGHVAVVSDIITEREVIVNHANWKRNEISFEMSVVDVSKKNDWTLVRVESQPGRYGQTYPVNGFIYPNIGG